MLQAVQVETHRYTDCPYEISKKLWIEVYSNRLKQYVKIEGTILDVAYCPFTSGNCYYVKTKYMLDGYPSEDWINKRIYPKQIYQED
jgi:hypothetical protein